MEMLLCLSNCLFVPNSKLIVKSIDKKFCDKIWRWDILFYNQNAFDETKYATNATLNFYSFLIECKKWKAYYLISLKGGNTRFEEKHIDNNTFV